LLFHFFLDLFVEMLVTFFIKKKNHIENCILKDLFQSSLKL
jgi:hypothetical protein